MSENSQFSMLLGEQILKPSCIIFLVISAPFVEVVKNIRRGFLWQEWFAFLTKQVLFMS
jgi:hypothetical protein